MSRHFFRQRGLSLVELMVALTIGLIVLAAVSTVFVNSRAHYTTQESLARLQENGRFAMHFLARDLRMAGYYGCAGDLESVNSTLASSASYDFSKPIEAIANDILYPSQTALPFPQGGTAVTAAAPSCPDYVGGRCADTGGFVVRRADADTAVNLAKTMPNSSAAAFVEPGHGLSEGEIVMLSDCAGADIFQITSIGTDSSSGKVTLVHNSGSTSYPPGNTTQKLERIYEEGKAQIMRFVNRVYYIGTGQSGHPALFVMNVDGAGGAQELVEGIDNLELLFGVDTQGDGTPRAYRTADELGTDPDKWATVVSARVTLTVRPIIDPGSNPGVNPNEVKERPFTSTVLMRNLQ
jgi:type IV pilus assembly protein PilW